MHQSDLAVYNSKICTKVSTNKKREKGNIHNILFSYRLVLFILPT